MNNTNKLQAHVRADAICEAAVQCCPLPTGTDADLSEFNDGYNAALVAVCDYAKHLREQSDD